MFKSRLGKEQKFIDPQVKSGLGWSRQFQRPKADLIAAAVAAHRSRYCLI